MKIIVVVFQWNAVVRSRCYFSWLQRAERFYTYVMCAPPPIGTTSIPQRFFFFFPASPTGYSSRLLDVEVCAVRTSPLRSFSEQRNGKMGRADKRLTIIIISSWGTSRVRNVYKCAYKRARLLRWIFNIYLFFYVNKMWTQRASEIYNTRAYRSKIRLFFSRRTAAMKRRRKRKKKNDAEPLGRKKKKPFFSGAKKISEFCELARAQHLILLLL